MPAFDINETHRVLVSIPEGKSFISHPDERRNQSPQKGGTCWYYVLNYLRIRYGKAIDQLANAILTMSELKELKEDKDFLALMQGRIIEKRVSAYRKELTALTLATDPQIRDLLAKLKPELKNQLQDISTEQTSKLALQFMKDIGYSYIEDDAKQSAKNFAGMMTTFLTNLPEGVIDHLQAEWLHNLVIVGASSKYQLVPSSWTIQQGFSALMSTLKAHGALSVGGFFGQNCYKAPAKKLPSRLAGREVCYWEKGTKIDFNERKGLHEILVVGAEESDSKQYIYYIDPNNGSKALEKQKLYKISYEQFSAGLVDLGGGSLVYNYLERGIKIMEGGVIQSPDTKKPLAGIKAYADQAKVGFHANHKLIDETKQQYVRVMHRIQQINPELYNKLNRSEEKKATVVAVAPASVEPLDYNTARANFMKALQVEFKTNSTGIIEMRAIATQKSKGTDEENKLDAVINIAVSKTTGYQLWSRSGFFVGGRSNSAEKLYEEIAKLNKKEETTENKIKIMKQATEIIKNNLNGFVPEKRRCCFSRRR